MRKYAHSTVGICQAEIPTVICGLSGMKLAICGTGWEYNIATAAASSIRLVLSFSPFPASESDTILETSEVSATKNPIKSQWKVIPVIKSIFS